MNPDDPNVVYVGFSRTIDGGANWTDMEGGGSAALVIDPTDPNVLYGVDGGGVLKTHRRRSDLVARWRGSLRWRLSR